MTSRQDRNTRRSTRSSSARSSRRPQAARARTPYAALGVMGLIVLGTVILLFFIIIRASGGPDDAPVENGIAGSGSTVAEAAASSETAAPTAADAPLIAAGLQALPAGSITVNTVDLDDPVALEAAGVSTDYLLTLVNSDFAVPQGYSPNLKELAASGLAMDTTAADHFVEMQHNIDAGTGTYLILSSGYRSPERQAELKKETPGPSVQAANHSEHQMGLAADVYQSGSPTLTEAFASTPTYAWLDEHAHEYGFILRYHEGKEAVTGVPFEPWHFRYVGPVHAPLMKASGLVHEEYLEAFSLGTWYRAGEYVISRQAERTAIAVPEGATATTVSPDNTGHYIVTAALPA